VPSYRNLAEYNDAFMLTARRFLKGEEDQTREFSQRSRRNPAACGVMNYMACHNGFTLLDLVSYDEKHNEANLEENKDGSNYNYSWNCGEEGPSRKKHVQKLRAKQQLLPKKVPLEQA
jgi:glycogen operon protein